MEAPGKNFGGLLTVKSQRGKKIISTRITGVVFLIGTFPNSDFSPVITTKGWRTEGVDDQPTGTELITG
ncbi:MAG: hypothetical protein CMO31_07925 [Trueperaceae bacterium]|nr:hypothetical protein [Trueperaceae bacterium]